MFSRAIGFAPNGAYWRLLRRIASTHLFAPRRIAAYEPWRQLDCATMLSGIYNEQSLRGINNEEAQELLELVREGFELLGAFNWSDYLPWLNYFYDPCRIKQRCCLLVPRVKKLVKKIIDEHRITKPKNVSENADFVHVLLSLEGEEKLDEDDMVAVLWEMIFRGTDTTALLTEWIMAELVLNPKIQAELRNELNFIVGNRSVKDADVAKLPYLQAVIKETLRVHPPGPLLSWARLSTSDVHLSNGMVVPSQHNCNGQYVGHNP
ncbi:hypothetical protein OIU78_021967 [Salix suchowensis]|nr:hypothetical protein OIU78_021967 [Salix suchowensis]